MTLGGGSGAVTLSLTTRVEHVTACPWVWFLSKKRDVKGGGGGGGQKVNVIVTLRSAKVVWKCPLTMQECTTKYSSVFNGSRRDTNCSVYSQFCLLDS